VRATLASLEVKLPDIIEDATQKQKSVRDKIADFHAKNAELEKQLAAHRKEIAALETDLKETTDVKDRLQQAESSSSVPMPGVHAAHKAPMTTLIGTTASHDEPTVIPKA
jgi:phage shock protein A